ncbi:hypothetical protein CODIS_12280 [Candidatus Thiodiazotropha endolucinida]|uniref:Uncharacterized protein n=1 Tax=Candidatus Thiodiazotropha endolucinida TaxID=1655433 RepID=A0A7Z1AG85_9GAMM|nr:hypothetical protein CODIS_12280 [Candidatus Thiodiazotropha endolucinida]
MHSILHINGKMRLFLNRGRISLHNNRALTMPHNSMIIKLNNKLNICTA